MGDKKSIEELEALIASFGDMRITLTDQVSVDVREDQLVRLNQIFGQIYEAWLMMLPEERNEFNERYLRAQSDYHFVGGAILHMLRPPVVFHPSLMMPPQRAADGSFEGDNQATDTPIEANDQTSQVSATGHGHSEEASSAQHEMSEMANQAPMFTQEQLNAAVQAAAEQAMWSSINFSTYTQMLRPIYELPQVDELSDRAIDNIIGAIQHVTDNAVLYKVELDQHTVRALILHIVATLDKVTKKCWLHRAKNAEPDLDFFLGFLMDERSEEPHPKKFIIPKVSQPAPVAANEPNNPIAGPSGEANKKKKKTARANSQNRANVNLQIQQANAQAANQPGAANQRAMRTPGPCPMCNQPHILRDCPQFMGRSYEDREAILFRNGWCINCLSTTHDVSMCLSGPCKVCGKRHNSVLHHR